MRVSESRAAGGAATGGGGGIGDGGIGDGGIGDGGIGNGDSEIGGSAGGHAARRLGRPRRHDVDGRVVQAVLVALARDGYSRLRIDDIAAEAGVAKTTVYRRWPTKNALVAAAVSQLYFDRVQPVDRGDLRSDLVALLADTRHLLFEGSGRVLEDLVRESGRARELAGIVRATNDARRRAFHLAMNRAVARGELDAAVEHDLLIDLLLGPFWTRLLVTGDLVTTGHIEAIIDAVLDGVRLGAPQGRPAPPLPG